MNARSLVLSAIAGILALGLSAPSRAQDVKTLKLSHQFPHPMAPTGISATSWRASSPGKWKKKPAGRRKSKFIRAAYW